MKKTVKGLSSEFKIYYQEFIKKETKHFNKSNWKTDPIGSRKDFNSILIESKVSYLRKMIENELIDIQYNTFKKTYHSKYPLCKIEYFDKFDKQDKIIVVITVYFKKNGLPNIDQTEFNYVWDKVEKGYKFYFHPDDNIEYLYEYIRELYRKQGGTEKMGYRLK